MKYLSQKTRFKGFQCNYMIHIHSIPSHFPFSAKIHYTPKRNSSECVCADLTTRSDIYYKLVWKYSYLCLAQDKCNEGKIYNK